MIWAQTKIGLFQQLQLDGYTHTQLLLVLRTFEFAAAVFSGRFQTCGKPFLAHGIGTASILGHLRTPAELVAAGLIHNVYLYGEFGSGVVGSSRSKTKYLRRIVGDEVEVYLARFAEFGIAPHSIQRLQTELPRFSFFERQILLLSLCETLEKLQNLEPFYQSNFADINKFFTEQSETFTEMAKALRYPVLAEAFANSIQEIQSDRVPVGLPQTDRIISFFLPPKSFFRRSSKRILTIKPV